VNPEFALMLHNETATVLLQFVKPVAGRRDPSTASDAKARLMESQMRLKRLFFLSAAMLVAAGSHGFAQATKEPHVRVAEIEIDPAQLEAYTTAIKEQVESALRLESGVLALYSVADKENPSHVTIFEIYTDAEA